MGFRREKHRGSNEFDTSTFRKSFGEESLRELERDQEAISSGLNYDPSWSLDQIYELEAVLNELNARNAEALSVYAPVPDATGFHQCMAHEVGLIGPNRAGKSVTAGAEVAMAATGRHPVHGKYKPRNLEIALVGPTEFHLRLLYYILFSTGKTFKVLNYAPGQWRVPRYDNPEDVALINDWQDVSPLIPPRMVSRIAWDSPREEVPNLVNLVNGTNIYFYSFRAEPPRGVSFDLVWMDEENERAKMWLSEMRMRIVSRRGRIIWSATPENATPTFYNLKARSERPGMSELPPIKQTGFFELQSKNNPFIDQESFDASAEKIEEDDPEAALAKVHGQSAFSQFLIYPEFSHEQHLVDPFDITWEDTVYLVIDPGNTRAACLFLAVLNESHPKFMPECPDRIIAFDELLIYNCNAFKMARGIRDKLDKLKHWVEDITFDNHRGRLRQEDGRTIAECYWSELKEAGVEPRIDRFIHGEDNLKSGIERVKQHLVPREGPPRFVCMKGRVPDTIWEFRYYQKKRGADGRPTDEIRKKKNDLMDCVRYACCRGYACLTPPGHSTNKADTYSAEELRRIDKNPRLWMYETMFPNLIRRRRVS